MKIAYFSPLPPRRTGIANYSKHLAVELARYAEVELFHDGPSEFSELPVCDYLGIPSSLDRLSKFDVLLYHFGNSPDFHLNMWHIFQWHPGVVVLHDAVLYYLMAARGKGGLLRESLGGRATTLTRLRKALKIVEETTTSGWLQGHEYPQNHPCLTSVLEKAQGVVVHSRTAEQIVREAGYSGLLEVIPLLVYQEELEAVDSARSLRLQTRTELGIHRGEILVGCFGFQNKVKRTEVLVRAVAKQTPSLPLKLLFAGMGEVPEAQIKKSGVASRILCPGYLSDVDFRKQIAACDVIANLRYPSMGETSATLIQAMTHGKACIVTDDSWFSELPDDCVLKIPYGRREGVELAKALEQLATSPGNRGKLGRKAQAYVTKHHNPETVRLAYLKVLDEWRSERRVYSSAAPSGLQEISPVAGYFSKRLQEVLRLEKKEARPNYAEALPPPFLPSEPVRDSNSSEPEIPPIEIPSLSQRAVSFAKTKKRKLSCLRPLLATETVVLETKYAFHCVLDEERSRYGFVNTEKVSEHEYDEFALKIIDSLNSGEFALDCGSGRRPTYYEQVVNFDPVPYETTDVVGFGEMLPFKDASFEAVFSLNVLEHVRDPFRCAKEIARVLKPGGKLYCVVPFMSPYHGYPDHYYNMTASGLANLFRGSLEIERQDVIASGLPIFSLTWILRNWADGLSGESKSLFLSQKVEQLIGDPQSYLDQPFVRELSQEKNFELGATTALWGKKLKESSLAGGGAVDHEGEEPTTSLVSPHSFSHAAVGDAYRRLYDQLRVGHGEDQALELVVGGDFEEVGLQEIEILQHFGLKETDFLVDVGCGSGRLAIPLSNTHKGGYLGTDVVPETLEYARQRVCRKDWRFEFVEDLTIPLPDQTADMVCFFSVFTHLLHEQSFQYLREALRVLKPSGRIVFSFLDFEEQAQWSHFESSVHHFGRGTPLNVFMDRNAIRAWTEILGVECRAVWSASRKDRGDFPVPSFGHSLACLAKVDPSQQHGPKSAPDSLTCEIPSTDDHDGEDKYRSSTVSFQNRKYKQTWTDLSSTYEVAKLHVTGETQERELRASGKKIVQRLIKSIGIDSSDTVLEIGCGIGRIGRELASKCRKWIGCDISPNMLEYAGKRLSHLKNIELVELPESNLSPIPDSSVDAVYCSVVFMHLDEWDRYEYVKEASRVLRPGGRVYVDNFNLLADEGWHVFEVHHAIPANERHAAISVSSTPQELEAYLIRSGFKDIRLCAEKLWTWASGRKGK